MDPTTATGCVGYTDRSSYPHDNDNALRMLLCIFFTPVGGNCTHFTPDPGMKVPAACVQISIHTWESAEVGDHEKQNGWLRSISASTFDNSQLYSGISRGLSA